MLGGDSRQGASRMLRGASKLGPSDVAGDAALRGHHVGSAQASSTLRTRGAPAREELDMELAGAGESVSLRVQVVGSRPVILDGGVRHWIRLEILEAVP